MKKMRMMPDIIVPDGMVDRRLGTVDDLPYDMKKWLRLIMGGNEKFGKGSQGIALNVKISNKIDAAKKELILEDEEYREVSVGKENANIGTALGRGCHLYYTAFDEAVDVEIDKVGKQK